MGDLSAGTHLTRAASIVSRFNPSRRRYSINEVIELYSILIYIQQGAYLTTWSAAEKAACLGAKTPLYRAVSGYFNSISGTNFSQKIKRLDRLYISDFLDLFVKFKLHLKVTERQFKNSINSLPISTHALVKNESLVKIYPDLIKATILADAENAEIILKKYLVKQDENRQHLHLPANMTEAEKIKLIDEYIEKGSANVNYLRLIGNARPEDGFNIPDDVRLKALRKENAETDEMFAGNSGLQVTYQIEISKKQTQEVISKPLEHGICISFSEKWLKENLDYPTILNNFIYLFEYARPNMLIELISTESGQGIIERFMGVKGKADYPKGVQFDSQDYISTMEMFIYREFLQEQNVRLEAVIEWFFSTYVKEYFKIDGFMVTMPSQASSYKEKCSYIFPQMESMLKQFNVYVSKGEIDQELVRVSTSQIVYGQLPSLNKQKYLYAKAGNNDIRSMLFLLFSDQSSLVYINDDKNAHTLYELLLKHKVAYKEFQHHQVESVDWLKQMTILKVEKGQVTIKNRARLSLLALLNQSEAISYHHLSDLLKKEADVMLKKGLLESGDTLLTKSEAAYFNYHLNKKVFGNGLDLKNRYSHGTPPLADDDNADIYKQHYIVGLKLIILLLIKMNDDLCIYSDSH